MSRLSNENVTLARTIISRYPRKRSALIPLLHLAQEQEGWVSPEAMAHIGELVDMTSAEVLGTASFYEMFKRQPIGKYLIGVCTNISCMLVGGYELLDHVSSTLGVVVGQTTSEGLFTVEEAECQAACSDAPCLQVNYRYFGRMDPAKVDDLLDDLRHDRLEDIVPPHGTLSRVRQKIGDPRQADAALSGEARP